MWKIILLCIIGISTVSHAFAEERPLVIVIPSHNNQHWYLNNLKTAIGQQYEKYRIIYINDCSSDSTGKIVEEYVKQSKPDSYRVISFDNSSNDIAELTARFKEEVNRDRKFFILINNTNRSGALQNHYLANHSCDDNEIVVNLDGDDWFPHDQVLSKLNSVYASGEVWLTHGKMIEYPSGATHWCIPIPQEIITNGQVRSFRCPSHLRTYYAGLFKKIQLEDLLYQGKFFAVTCDMAMMYPMVEMAAERHAYIGEVNYVYNRTNPINDDKVHTLLQRHLDGYIRGMKPYPRLENRPF